MNAKIITEGHSVEEAQLKVKEFMFTRLIWQVGARLGMLVVMTMEGRNISGHSRFHYKRKEHPSRVLM